MIPAGLANLNEAAAVAWAIANNVDTYEGVARKQSHTLDVWKANLAYWRAYPLKARQVDPADVEGVAAWLRLHAAVQAELVKEAPPAYNASKPRWPLTSPVRKWGAGGTYGARRPWKKSKTQTRYHCGVDIDADEGSPVVATEGCTIVGIDVGWESPTKCLIVHLDSGNTLLFGGLKKGSMPAVGTHVEAGELIARVTAYPYGDTMLHVQMYEGLRTVKQVQANMSWYLGEAEPSYLMDPRDYLEAAAANTPLNPQNAAFASFGESVGDPDYEAEQDEGTPAQVNGAVAVPPPPPASSPSNAGAYVVGGLAIAAVVALAARKAS